MPRFDWERIIRRVQLHHTTKGVALIMASYADGDGTRIRPGVERLARVLCASDKTVRRHVKTLCDLGFLERTKHGNRHSGEVNEYRLTMPADLLGRLPMIDPSEMIQVSLTVMGDRQTNGGRGMSNGHPDVSNGHPGTCLTVMGDRPPVQDQPLPVQGVLQVTTLGELNTNRIKPNPILAEWKEMQKRKAAGQ